MSDFYSSNMYNPDVLSCIANLSNDEVFTPPEIANAMLDMLPQELFSNPETTFLDPTTKSGIFLREIAKRLIVGIEKTIPDLQERIDHIFQKQLYGIAITELTSHLSRRSLYCSKCANMEYSVTKFENIDGNIRFKNIEHTFKDGKCLFCGASEKEYGKATRGEELESHAYELIHTTKPEAIFNMKFDVIIGNPPYQLNDGGGTGSSATPLYNKFIESAKKLNPRYLTMIIPSRWFTGGKGLDNFRNEMLHDNRIKEIHDFGNSSDCFPGVSVEGGICYFLWQRDSSGLCKVYTHVRNEITSHSERPLLEKGSDVFIRQNQAISIIRKVQKLKEITFDSIVSPRNPYKFDNNLFNSNESSNNTIRVLGIENKKRIYKNFSSKSIGRNNNEISKYKLFISKADGAAGQIGYPIPARIIGKAELGEPNTICTETFLRIGPFENKSITLNVKKYTETKFFRLLVGVRKNKNMTQSTYSFVPMQDFRNDSNINWNNPIEEIDKELYKKYNLSEEEINFIESMIKPMDLGGDE